MKSKRAHGGADKRRRTASDYIEHWDTIQPGDRVVIAYRVSTQRQDDNGNLADQCEFLIQKAIGRGAEIVGDRWHVGNGSDPSWLEIAVRDAKEFDAKIIAESTDRLIRHHDYDKWHQPLQATEVELDELRRCTLGVTLVTYRDPDAKPGKIRSRQISRGQQMKDRKGGRPTTNKPGYKKHRRANLRPDALALHADRLSVRDISEILKVPLMTVHGWLRPRRF